MHQLEHISDGWLGRKDGQHVSEMGFSMGRLDELTDIAERADAAANIYWTGSTDNAGTGRFDPRSAYVLDTIVCRSDCKAVSASAGLVCLVSA
jgi:hypothetical protein